jgi:hypothetical protein
MSGGHFDYNQYQIEDIAEQLERDIDDIEYSRNKIGKVKKKELYGYLISDEGRKSYPFWLINMCGRYTNREDLLKSLVDEIKVYERDGKIFVKEDGNDCEVVIYEGETEEWADDHWHFEIENPEVLEEFKRGLRTLKMAAIYAQRIDWLMSGDDGEESFKRRLKEELDELDSKPLIDYERWKRYREENK